MKQYIRILRDPGWEQLGMQTASDAVGAGMGMLIGGWQDKRQLKQQEKLQKLQISGNKEMTDYQKMKELEMWKATGYKGQMEQLKLAGLNPGLLYGMSGGGGSTLGGSGASVQGGTAASGSGEIQAMMGMGIQKQLLEAQKRVLETQADKNAAEAASTGGIETKQREQAITESQAKIESIKQGIQNAKAQEALTKVQTNLSNMTLALDQKTFEARADRIEYETRQAFRQVEIMDASAYVASVTRNDAIKAIQAEAINKLIQGAVMEAQIAKTGADIANIKSGMRVNEQAITESVNRIMREWDQMSQENQKILLQKIMADHNTDPLNQIMDIMQGVIGGIIGGAASRGLKGGRTVIEGFRKQ